MTIVRYLILFALVGSAAAAAAEPPREKCAVSVRAKLALVPPGGEQSFAVSLVNPTSKAIKAAVRLFVEYDLADRIDVDSRTITVAPGERAAFTARWKPAEELWGCFARVEAEIGDRRLAARDVFTVSTNAIAASPICQTILATRRNNDAQKRLRADVDRVRDAGSLLLEHFNWQASTWGPVYPRKDFWQAGMSPSGRSDDKKMIKYVARLVHERGMKFMTYAAPVFAGPEGYRWVKRHPDDLLYPTPDGKIPMKEKLASVATANTLRRKTLDQGLDEYIKVIRDFGYDGIRWDGHPGRLLPSVPRCDAPVQPLHLFARLRLQGRLDSDRRR